MSLLKSKSNHKNWLTQALTNHHSARAFFEPVVQIINPNWQANKFVATVAENRIESDLVFSLILKPAIQWPTFEAGQHIDLQVEINGTRFNRTFSLSHAPEHHGETGLIELTIRQQDQGKVTPWLATNLTAGSTIHISAARGSFTLPTHKTPLLLIAGGSGITPFRSFIHKLSKSTPDQNVHLIYYNQSTLPLFADEWQELAQIMPNLTVTLIDTDLQGMISKQQLLDTCPDHLNRIAYVCGPHGLITTSRDLLLELGINEADIHHELFGPKPINKTRSNFAANISFSQSGTQIKAPTNTPMTLLELAESAGTQPQSGCRMGVCHQCKCIKKQGVIYNTLTETYSDTGTEDIQLCVSVAVGDVTLEL